MEETISISVSDAMAGWLSQFPGALAITTYQAGKMAVVGWDGQKVVLLLRDFDKPMGLATRGRRMAIATRHAVVELANAPLLAPDYLSGGGPTTYDGLWLPRVIHCTGDLNIHDLAYGKDGLWIVNTRFSCLARLSAEYSFEPAWRPPFVSDLAPEDRCHRQGDGDLDILKYSGNGSLTWSRSLATAYWVPADLEVNASGSVYVAGTFQGIVDFDPSSKVKYASSGPMSAGFVLNLDTAGKFNWVTPFVGKTVDSTNGYAFGQSISLDNNGGIIVGGLYRNTVDFNLSAVTTSLDPVGGAYVAKLNSSGGLVWARAFTNAGTGAYANASAVTTDFAGNIYATGSFGGSIDLDPGAATDTRTTNGSNDVFVAKLTATGNYVWGETFGGVSAESSLGVAVDTTGNVHMTIYYVDQVDFDPSPTTTQLFGSPGAKRNGLRLRLAQA